MSPPAGLQSLCFSPPTSPPLLPRAQQPPVSLSTKPVTPQISYTLPAATTISPASDPRAAGIQQLLPDLPSHVKEKILCLEIMGIDFSKALSANPCLQTATLDSIHEVVSYLQSKGIHQKDMGRILGMCPGILTADVRADLAPVFHFLSRDLGVPDSSFRRSVNKCPRLLVSSVRDQLKPALLYLQRLGFRDMQALAYQDPVLLVSSVERTLMPKLEFLQRATGFTREEAVAMVLRCPGLFTFSIENNLKPKLGYFVGEMRGILEELKEFPQYFAFSLEKRIKPRHLLSEESGVRIPLSLMLKTTDEEFKQLLVDHQKEEEEQRGSTIPD